MLRRWLLCGRLDGNSEALDRLKAAIEQRKPQGILFAGGICGPSQAASSDKLPHAAAELYDRFFRTLGETGIYTALVPGWYDLPLDDFMRVAMNAEVDFPNIHVAHGTLFVEGDVAICGVGGELGERGGCKGEHLRRSRTSAEYLLRMLWKSDASRKILLLGSPPTGRLGGSIGSEVAGELIDSYHPDLCVVAGETEHRGTDRVAHTLVVNPGRLADGSAAWLDWTRPENEQCEMLSLK